MNFDSQRIFQKEERICTKGGRRKEACGFIDVQREMPGHRQIQVGPRCGVPSGPQGGVGVSLCMRWEAMKVVEAGHIPSEITPITYANFLFQLKNLYQ